MKTAIVLFVASLALPLFAADSPLLNQGKAALDRGDADTAAKLLEQAVAQQPNNADAHYLLGGAYGRQAQKASMFSGPGLAKKAKAELLRAVAIDPNHLDARMALIEFYMVAPGFLGGSEEEASKQANEIKKRDAIRGHRAWSFIYNQQKKPDLARKEHFDMVREQPNSPVAHYWLGVFHIGDKNNKAAAEEFETALKLDPKYMPAVFQIGHMAALNGADYARGEEALRRYLTYTPQEGEPSAARAHYWLGQIYEKQGKKNEAKQNYEASLKLNPAQKDVAEALKRVS